MALVVLVSVSFSTDFPAGGRIVVPIWPPPSIAATQGSGATTDSGYIPMPSPRRMWWQTTSTVLGTEAYGVAINGSMANPSDGAALGWVIIGGAISSHGRYTRSGIIDHPMPLMELALTVAPWATTAGTGNLTVTCGVRPDDGEVQR